MKILAYAAMVAILGSSQSALAQDNTFGAIEYGNSCAQCHGMDGKGGGPMAGFLTGTLPDLTQLQKDNGGVFPVTRVYGVIDGSTELGPHGTREMPAWGNRYKLDAQEHLSYDFGPSRETYVRTRVLALIEHLAAMQE